MSSNGSGVFPVFGRPGRMRKAAGFQRLLKRPRLAGGIRGASSEPPGTAPVRSAVPVVTVPVRAAIPAAVEATVHAALEPVLAPALGAKSAVLHMGQQGETALLVVVQGLVEGIGSIGDLLQGSGRVR